MSIKRDERDRKHAASREAYESSLGTLRQRLGAPTYMELEAHRIAWCNAMRFAASPRPLRFDDLGQVIGGRPMPTLEMTE